MSGGNWKALLYGVILDDAGSCDYYETLEEAASAAAQGGILVRVTTTEIQCLCYSTPSPRCEIHG